MTKKTMKRRKKNVKLKRAIRKTVAALIMIMAVIVAAIPVEQLGTMQAKTVARTDVDLEEVYKAYADEANGMKDNKIEAYISDSAKYNKKAVYDGTSSDSADYQIVTIENSILSRQFLVDKRTEGDNIGTGVIVGYSGEGGNVVIEEEMSTGYFTINQNYIDAVEEVLSKETYKVSFGTRGTATVHSDLGSNKKEITVPAQISTTSMSYNNQREAGTIDVDVWDAAVGNSDLKTYKYVNGLSTGLKDEDIFKTYATSAYSSKINEIDTYNTGVADLNAEIAKAVEEDADGAGKNISAEKISSWQKRITELEELNESAKMLEVSYQSGMDDKESFLKAVISKRFYRDNASGALDKYTLEKIINDRTIEDAQLKGIYVPRWTSGGTKPDNADSRGYITTGKIKITGIGNEAFKGITNNLSVTLSPMVEFIGNEAFMDCYQLTTVDLAYCKVVGNRAFSGCGNLTTVSFGSNDDPKKAGILGAEAFYNCQKLKTVSFPQMLSVIGRGCFARSGLESFYVSENLFARELTLYPFAFFECKYLGQSGDVASYFPDMTGYNLTIGLGAFALTSGGGSIKKFGFPEGMKRIINTVNDEFGLDNALANVNLPNYDKQTNSPGEIYYDYILAGRSNLEEIVFPKTLIDTKIPDNTLMGCSGLLHAVFGKCSYNDADCVDVTFDSPDLSDKPEDEKDFDTDGDKETLFQDVTSTAFYMEGPGFRSNGAISSTRQCAGAAQTINSDFVPYKYLNADGSTQMEMSYGANNEYLAIVSANSDGKTATLKEFKYVDKDNTLGIPNLIIPAKIGDYTITALGENCFDDNIIDKIYELTIQDGSITSINAHALEGADNLRSVTIGNSVKSIGESAFAGCDKLRCVFFTNPIQTGDGWESVLNIDSTAFNTGSESLTFYGEIHPGYGPYELAMDPKINFTDEANKNICYKTPAPSNLTVILDNATGDRTLVDYPHYNEINVMNQEFVKELEETNDKISGYNIIDKFEAVHGWNDTVNNKDDYISMGLTTDEKLLVLSALSVQIPEGVTSVDAKTFFKNSSGSNSNEPNFEYLTQGYERIGTEPYFQVTSIERAPNDNNYNDIIKLYSEDNYKESKVRGYASDTVIAGLFSGYFYDDKGGKSFIGNEFSLVDNEAVNNQLYVETVAAGNDLLTNVGLGSAKILPDFAFRSCENLLSVSLGNGMYDLGNAPFRGCTKLTGITGNERFFSDKAVIYENTEANLGAGIVNLQNPTGAPYRIVECLESRGTNAVLPDYIDGDVDGNLALVGSVEEEAFAYCEELTGVDLSDTKITKIPDGCFKASGNIRTVVLPETAGYIGKDAFADTKTDVYIYNPDCQIDGAFGDAFTGKIYGYKYKDDSNTEESAVYTYCKENGLEQQFKQIGYIVTFMAEDSVIATKSVNKGGSVSAPEAPEKTGYKFTGWAWKTTDSNGKEVKVTGDAALTNIAENRKLVATYDVGNGIVSDGSDYKLKIEGGKDHKGETEIYPIIGGTSVYLETDTSNTSKVFQYWTAIGTKVNEDKTPETIDCTYLLEDLHEGKTLFIMPNMDVVITAHFTSVDVGGTGGSGSGSGSGNGSGSGSGTGSDSEGKYKVTVNYGSGSGEYKPGEVVTINAFAAESNSKVFSKWTSTNTSLGFADATKATTTFVMPAAAVTITANYKTRSYEEEDDSELEALNRRKNQSTTTVSTGTNNATITTTTGTVTNTTQTSTGTSDSITINKDGISNTGVASTQVSGATDNFVVKVSDSTDAVAQAEEALKNKYGSLDGILYFPMDITLYDVTGKNKIEDTSGLNVTVTIPIPDEMIQYGGNVRAAAIENGQLQELNVRFTTIDGIACMSFVPPHFSPYVIYVDTNNLVAGQLLDATPKTGDPIHPKWFLAMGMACLSIILFATGDKKKNYKLA